MPSQQRKRRLPLADQLTNDKIILKPKKKTNAKQLLDSESEDDTQEIMSSKLTQKVMKEADAQRQEDALDDFEEDPTPTTPFSDHSDDDRSVQSDEEVSDIELDIDAEDDAALQAFFGRDQITSLDDPAFGEEPSRCLSSMILDRIQQHEQQKTQATESLET
ncbi:hypothetical protein GEMRC1_011497 [Eukaryota sp. GEM-RC1]